MMSAIDIREIQSSDLRSVADLLIEGFPSRTRSYWERGLDSMSRRPETLGCPRYGLLMTADQRIVGVLIAIWSNLEGDVRCNLSSWYVRKPYRAHSMFMLTRALSRREATYLDLTPAPATQPIVRAAGFRPYTGGAWIVNCGLALSRSKIRVSAMRTFDACGLDSFDSTLLDRHLVYGCSGVLLEDERGSMPVLYRTKRYKGIVPIAFFLTGAPPRLLQAVPALSRHLLLSGVPLALIDAPLTTSQTETLPRGVAFEADRGVRYTRGDRLISTGDLRECELAIFGP